MRIGGGDWRQNARSNRREAGREAVGKRPITASVEAVDTNAEELSLRSAPGAPDVPVNHPYMSVNSWHRTMPETGTSLMIQQRFDNSRYFAFAYHNANGSRRIDDYMTGAGVYRPLQPGEQDLMSYGLASIFMSKEGTLEMRGGMVYGEMNHRRMEHWVKAPTHRRLLHLHDDTKIGDEERVGVVYRQMPPDYGVEPIKINAIETPIGLKGGYFAKERYFALSTGDIPAQLLRHREGNVIDDLGQKVLHSITSQPLRMMSEYFNSTDTGSLTMEIDELGNLVVNLPKSALDGVKLKIPMADLVAEVQNKIRMETKLDDIILQALAKNILLTAKLDVGLTSQTANIKLSAAKNIEGKATNVTLDAKSTITATAKSAINTKAATIKAEASGAYSVKAGTVAIDSPSVKLGSKTMPMGMVVTTLTHPVDFVTGIPIRGSAIVRASG